MLAEHHEAEAAAAAGLNPSVAGRNGGCAMLTGGIMSQPPSAGGLTVVEGAKTTPRKDLAHIPSPSTLGTPILPDALATTLDHIVGQLEIITRTMGVLEQRLVLTENRVSQVGHVL